MNSIQQRAVPVPAARKPVDLVEWRAIAANLTAHVGRAAAQSFLAANFFLVVREAA